MRHSLVLVGVCLAIGSIAAAEPGWIDFGNGSGEVRVDVHRSGPQGVELELALAGVSLSTAATEGGSFTVAEIPDLGRIGQPGEPALPALRRFVEIPEGARAEVEIEVLERRTVDLAAEGLAAPIMPVQLPRPKCDCEEARAWRFSYKPEAYRGTVRHEAAALTGPFTFRDHRMMLLTVSPVAYDADLGRLEVATRARVSIRFDGGDLDATVARKERLASRHFDAFLDRATVNLNLGLESANWAYPDDAPVEFLIVTPPQFVADLAPFVDWKTSCGYHVTVATTDVTGTSNTAIKSYLTGLYNGPTPPVYILMIGDSPAPLPTWVESPGGGGGTDLSYVRMDSDLYPDMMIARWPIDDAAELVAMRDKILHYEQPTAGNSAWMNRALFLAGDDYMGRVTTHEDVIAQLMEPPPNSAECALWYGDTQNPTTQQLINDLNTGRAWTVYSAHSGPSGWSGDPPLSGSDMPNFGNTDMYPIAHGHSCSSNEWNAYDDVFGEAAVTQPNKGFVAYWGGSASTYWDEDDWLERGFFDAMFDTDMAGNLIPLDRQYSNVAACYSGLTEVTLKGGDEQYYWHCYNLNGDPTLDPFTRQPIALTVGAPAVVPPAPAADFEVTVSDSAIGPVPLALVGVSQNGVLLGAGMTDPTGTAVFPIAAPAAGTDVVVRVTAHNHLPTDATVIVAAGSDGVVTLDRSLYRCDASVTIDVYDDDLAGHGSQTVTLSAAPSGGSTPVVLTEVAGPVVRFTGNSVLGGDLAVAHGDTLTVSYYDQNTGGGSGQTKTDTAVLDCAGPVVSGLAMVEVGATTAVVEWTTDEPADSWAVALPGGVEASESGLRTEHRLELAGLEQCAMYRVEVASADGLGNVGAGGPTAPFVTLQQTVAMDDDVESGAGDWVVDTAIGGGVNWTIVTDRSHSPTHAWFSSDYGSVKDDRLMTGPIELGGGSTTVSFWHEFDFESGWDGGVLEVSTDGATWQDVTAVGSFVSGGYNDTLSTYGSNPLAGREAWSGSSGGFVATVVDLSGLAGSEVWLRYRLGCDGSVSDVGWWVDDIVVETTSACAGMPFADGFESGDCGGWSSQGP